MQARTAATRGVDDGSEQGSAGATPLEAVLFDMDGVITDTAEVHMAVWKRLFDAYLRARDAEARPFSAADYRRHVDGKPRYDGVESFLRSRGIELPFGDPEDGPDEETVCGLGNRKNRYFREWLAENPVPVFPGSRAPLDELAAAGIRAAVFSSSRNARDVLDSAGMLKRFEVKVDGQDMAESGLPGKPAPSIMLRAAESVDIASERAAVLEDAGAGIKAGAAGGFAQVVGIDRGAGEALEKAGADFVVADPADLAVAAGPRLVARRLHATSLVRDARDALAARVRSKRVAVFLDYDGTLTPIVEKPEDATLGNGMRAALSRLAARLPVAIVSGRDLADVQGLVRDDQLYYAGSHGFDLAGPVGWLEVAEQAEDYLPELNAAGDALEERLASIEGVRVERKRFALAVHLRRVSEADEAEVADAVRERITRHEELPVIIGGASAILAITLAANHVLMLPSQGGAEDGAPEEQRRAPSDIMRSLAPFAVMALALIASRTLPGLRDALQDATISFGEFRMLELDQELSPLDTPYFHLALALRTALRVFNVTGAMLREAAAATDRRLRLAVVVLIFIIALTRLLLWSQVSEAGLPSILKVLG